MTLSNWYLSPVPTSVTADNGNDNQGRFYNYGTNSATDRALGSLTSGAAASLTQGVQVTNNTGAPTNTIRIVYVGEQWRRGNLASDILQFQYSTNATSLTTGTWTTVSGLNFVPPQTGGSGTALDGNLPANRTTLTSTNALNSCQWRNCLVALGRFRCYRR